MSDDVLRELERQWKATAHVADEAAFLVARHRVGDLSSEGVELAAFCGHEAARRVVPDQMLFSRGTSLQTIASTVSARWGSEPVARMLVCLARIAAPTWTAAFPEDSRPLEALDAVEDHMVCPCTAHEDAMKRARTGAFEAARAVYESHGGAAYVAFAAGHAANYLEGSGGMGTSIKQLTGLVGDLWRRDTVLGELIPWALGYSDPFLARVQQRQAQRVSGS